MMDLKKYQQKALSKGSRSLIPLTNEILNDEDIEPNDLPKILVLKAITGSGKTIIASAYIEKLLSEDIAERGNKKTVIVWLSKGNGGLHIQSAEKISKNISTPDIHVIAIEDSSDFKASQFYDKDVYVINWEKINNEKRNILEFTERANIQQALKNTNRDDTNYVLIIDEFHLNYDTDSYNDIVKLFNPIIILGLTATPKKEQLAIANDNGGVVKIKVKDVQDEAMVKQGVFFDKTSGLPAISTYTDDTDRYLQMAILRREKLETQYQAEGIDVTPLLLIQFDDTKAGSDVDAQIQQVIQILDTRYPDAYAVWLDESYCKKVGIQRSDDTIIRNMDTNHIKALLFKQAIATGWDCPRAQVLLKYRHSSASESFDLQTLGRIFRMPEPDRGKYYDTEDLNYGYIYSNNDQYKLKKEFAESLETDDDKDAFAETNEYYILAKYQTAVDKINDVFAGENQHVVTDLVNDDLLCDKITALVVTAAFDIDLSSYNDEVVRHEAKMDIQDKMYLEDDREYIYKATKKMREKAVDTLFFEILGQKYNRDVVSHFKCEVRDHIKVLGESVLDNINKVILNNTDVIKQIASELGNYKKSITSRHQTDNSDFVVPLQFKVKATRDVSSNKCIYGHTTSGLSQPEKDFVDKLTASPNVLCWVKNADSGYDALGVKFDHNDSGVSYPQHTCPDFIVFFTNGDVGIYEIKDKKDTATTIAEKEIAILKRTRDLNINGGLVKVDQDYEYADTSNFPEI